MLSIRAIYDGNNIHFLEKVDYKEPQEVIVTFLKTAQKVKAKEHVDTLLVDYDIQATEIHALVQNGGSLDFLNNEEEDVYTDNDLKVKY